MGPLIFGQKIDLSSNLKIFWVLRPQIPNSASKKTYNSIVNIFSQEKKFFTQRHRLHSLPWRNLKSDNPGKLSLRMFANNVRVCYLFFDVRKLSVFVELDSEYKFKWLHKLQRQFWSHCTSRLDPMIRVIKCIIFRN